MKRATIIVVNSLLVLIIIGLIAATWLPAIYSAVHGSSQPQNRSSNRSSK